MTEAALIIAIAIVVIGLPSLSAWQRVRRANRARALTSGWRAVPGRITASEIIDRPGGESSLAAGSMRAAVWYEYVIDGRRYRNNVIDVGDEVLREDRPDAVAFIRVHAYESVERYPAGSDVTVYVDPADPERSCLSR